MNKELIEAINLLEKENNISKDVLLEAIENSLLTAYKNNYGRADNVKVNINRETGDFSIVAEREVVETVEDPMPQVRLAEAGRHRSVLCQFQGVWTYRRSEREECYLTEAS